MFSRSDAGKLGYQKTHSQMQQHREAQKAAAQAAHEANGPRCGFCGACLPYEKRRHKFCNRSCSASHNNAGIVRNPRKIDRRTHCLRCSQPIKAAGIIYCSRKRSHAYRVEQFAEKLLSGMEGMRPGSIPAIRCCLIRLRGEQCEECHWNRRNPVTDRVPLEVHHMDGNFENNKIGNIRLLCPNCHSLTPTFRNLNKGNGRGYRRIAPE